jgi:hypothetical protein
VIPAVKWQISPLAGKFDLSATFGAGLPTGTKIVAGPGLQPYVQLPWSWQMRDGWSISGMFSSFMTPADTINKLSTETTFVLERELGEREFLFGEYVGDYHEHGGPGFLLNSGGGYRVTPTQQIDFHVGIGLNHNTPAYVFGMGIHSGSTVCSERPSLGRASRRRDGISAKTFDLVSTSGRALSLVELRSEENEHDPLLENSHSRHRGNRTGEPGIRPII